MSFYQRKMIDLFMRLRLVCEARGIQPRDVRLADLSPEEQQRLRFLAEADFREMVNAEPTPLANARIG